MLGTSHAEVGGLCVAVTDHVPSKFPRAGRVETAPLLAESPDYFWEHRESTPEFTRIPMIRRSAPARPPTEEILELQVALRAARSTAGGRCEGK